MFQFQAVPCVFKSKVFKKRNYLEIEGQEVRKVNFYVNSRKTPEYIPLPDKIDKKTQIERRDKDLFDFDLEVIPLLEVIVRKVVDLAEIELREENNFLVERKEERQYQQKRNCQILKTQKMMNRFNRYKTEKQMRERQQKYNQSQKILVHQKMYCRNYCKKVICSDLINVSLDYVQEKGMFGLKKDIFIKKLIKNPLLELVEQRNQYVQKNQIYLNKQIEQQKDVLYYSNLYHLIQNRVIQEEIQRMEEVNRQQQLVLKQERQSIRKQKKQTRIKQIIRDQFCKEIQQNSQKIKIQQFLEQKIQDFCQFFESEKGNNIFFPIFYQIIDLIQLSGQNHQTAIDNISQNFLHEVNIYCKQELIDFFQMQMNNLEENHEINQEELKLMIDINLDNSLDNFLMNNEIFNYDMIKEIFVQIINIKYKQQKLQENCIFKLKLTNFNFDLLIDKIKHFYFIQNQLSPEPKKQITEEQLQTYNNNLLFEKFVGNDYKNKQKIYEKIISQKFYIQQNNINNNYIINQMFQNRITSDLYKVFYKETQDKQLPQQIQPEFLLENQIKIIKKILKNKKHFIFNIELN